MHSPRSRRERGRGREAEVEESPRQWADGRPAAPQTYLPGGEGLYPVQREMALPTPGRRFFRQGRSGILRR